MRAARYGAAVRMRRRQTSRPDVTPPTCTKLMEEEAKLNEARTTGDAGYSPTRHVEVLATLIAAAGQNAGT